MTTEGNPSALEMTMNDTNSLTGPVHTRVSALVRTEHRDHTRTYT